MKRRQAIAFLATLMTTLFLTIGGQLYGSSAVVAQTNTTLLVSAAASLQDAITEISRTYQQTKPRVKINYNFGASGALQRQIEQGAPADVFISAGKRQMDALEQKGLLATGTRSNLANNRLVLVVPKNVTGINSFYSLADAKVKRIAIGEPRSVPAGQYADQVLNKLGIYTKIRPKLVFANNVRQVLAAVESGNAEAGLVYATDAKISDKVKVVVAADEKYHSPIVYPMAVLKRSKNPEAAKEFVQFLSGEQAKIILQKYGFIVR